MAEKHIRWKFETLVFGKIVKKEKRNATYWKICTEDHVFLKSSRHYMFTAVCAAVSAPDTWMNQFNQSVNAQKLQPHSLATYGNGVNRGKKNPNCIKKSISKWRVLQPKAFGSFSFSLYLADVAYTFSIKWS